MTVREVIKVLETYAPLTFQESYDNAGLQVGHWEDEIQSILLCVDVTEEVIAEAITKNCNLIISHHPLIFSGIKSIIGSTFVEKVIEKAIKHSINIYSVHTNIDIVWGGVNIHAAWMLGLQGVEVLRPLKNHLFKVVTFVPVEFAERVRQSMFDAGAGNIGNYDSCSFNIEGQGTFRGNAESKPFVGEPLKLHLESEIRVETICTRHILSQVISNMLKAHPYEEPAYDIYPLENKYLRAGLGVVGNLENEIDTLTFLHNVKKIFNIPFLKYTKIIKNKTLRVAFCGGSGSELINDAIRVGADIFISADFKYHQFFNANNQITLVDIGHYESEQHVKEIFYQILRKNFSNFAIHFSEIKTNPVNYL